MAVDSVIEFDVLGFPTKTYEIRWTVCKGWKWAESKNVDIRLVSVGGDANSNKVIDNNWLAQRTHQATDAAVAHTHTQYTTLRYSL